MIPASRAAAKCSRHVVTPSHWETICANHPWHLTRASNGCAASNLNSSPENRPS
jgi:hypothetical protein